MRITLHSAFIQLQSTYGRNLSLGRRTLL